MLVSLGVDNHYRDPLASLSLSSDGHVRQARALMELSKRFGGRVTFMLEGGYDVPSLSEVVAGVVGAMKGVEVPWSSLTSSTTAASEEASSRDASDTRPSTGTYRPFPLPFFLSSRFSCSLLMFFSTMSSTESVVLKRSHSTAWA